MRELNRLESTVLDSVRHLKNGYGLTIWKETIRRMEAEVPIGAVYIVLGNLEGLDLIRSYEDESTPERGGRVKKHYTIRSDHDQLR